MEQNNEIKKRFAVSLDIKLPVSNREFTVVEGDTGNVLEITLRDNGVAVDLTSCRVIAMFSKSDGTTASQDSGTEGNGVTVGGTDNNVITVELSTGSFAPGMVECEIQVYSGANCTTLVTSAKFNFKCRRSIVNNDTILSVPQYPLLVTLIEQVTTLASTCAALVTSASDTIGNEETRVTAENARLSAESARIAAETARAEAEAGRAALEDMLEDDVASAATLITTLESAVDSLPDLVTYTGLIKGTGTGVAQAVAGTDYVAPHLSATALPASGTALAIDTAYTVATPVGTYVFTPPAWGWAHGTFTTAASVAVSFAAGSTFVGEAPKIEASKAYEFDVLDGAWVVSEVVSE